MTAAERAQIWRRAVAIAAEVPTPAPGRYFADADGPWSYEALVGAPDWLTWPVGRLQRFVRLVGAVGVARAWRTMIDGEPLQRAALAIGQDVLERVLDLSDRDLPRLPGQPAECGDGRELAGLGAALLLSGAPLAPCHVARLSRLAPAVGAPQDTREAELAVRTALALLAVTEGSA